MPVAALALISVIGEAAAAPPRIGADGQYEAPAPRAAKSKFNRIVVLGDSLSDVGRMSGFSMGLVPPSAAYWLGRFSDGFNWIDYLAQGYGVTVQHPEFIVNQSVGGATAFPYSREAKQLIMENLFKVKANFERLQAAFMVNLDGIIESFEKKYKGERATAFTSKDLVVIWMGANDMLWVADAVDKTLTFDKIAERATNYIRTAVQKIKGKGVKNFILIGNPNLNVTPTFNKVTPPDPKRAAQALEFNTTLQTLVATMTREDATLNMHFVNVDEVLQDVLLAPGNAAKFGIANTTDGVYLGPSLTIAPMDQMNFSVYANGETKTGETNTTTTFWDTVHPTTRTHAIIAEYIRRMVLDPNFENERTLSPCSYVEVENAGAYVLELTAVGAEPCGFPADRSLDLRDNVERQVTTGRRALFAVPAGTDLTVTAVLGDSKTFRIAPQPATFATKYRAAPINAPLRVQVPMLQTIRCTGTTLDFHCTSKLHGSATLAAPTDVAPTPKP